jgi:hypothetical protein
MQGGFAYVAYPAKYDDTGVKAFIVNQNRVVYGKNLGKETAELQSRWPNSIETTPGPHCNKSQ